MKLSVLDQLPVVMGESHATGYQHAIELAKLVDTLGYHRLWYSEHHDIQQIVSSAPEIIIAHVASITERIRVGSGGVMVPNYAPYKLAEVFKTLAMLYPDRIDMGLGRATGGTVRASIALRRGLAPTHSDLYEKIQDILGFMDEKSGDPTSLKAVPLGGILPEAWLLGSSGNSAKVAGTFGMGYSFAQFIGGKLSRDIVDTYIQHFLPSAFMPTPQVNLGIFATVAETKEEAEYHAAPMSLNLLLLERGGASLVSPEEALSYPYTEIEKSKIQASRQSGRHLVGSAKEVAETLRSYQTELSVDEVMVASMAYSQEARQNTYKLLAKEILK